MSSIEEFRLRNLAMAPGLEKLYANSADPLFRQGGKSLFEAMARLRAIESKIPPSTATYAAGRFGNGLKQIARLIKADVGLEVAFAEATNWDHHVAEGGTQGQIAQRLDDFSRGLAALATDLGERLSETVILTMSEFGRAVAENGNRGTDHGHGNAMLVIGGPVKGRKVYGKWPGLGSSQRFEGRDLAVTTDFREVFCEVATRHLSLTPDALARVFPGYTAQSPLGLIRT